MCQKPEGLTTTRFMMAHKANEFTEAGEPPSPEMIAKMGTLIGDMQKAGVFIATAGLPPSSHGTRLRFSKGEHTITDGPFAESKELIGGFILLQVNSKQEAIEWALRIGEALGDSEIDVVPVCEAPASTAAA
jgi:hypothetical protein